MVTMLFLCVLLNYFVVRLSFCDLFSCVFLIIICATYVVMWCTHLGAKARLVGNKAYDIRSVHF